MKNLGRVIAVALCLVGAGCARTPPAGALVGTTETLAARVSAPAIMIPAAEQPASVAPDSPQPRQIRQTPYHKASVAFALTSGRAAARTPVPAIAVSADDVAAVVRAIVDTHLSQSRVAAQRAQSAKVREIAARAARDFSKADETLTVLESLQPFDVDETAASKSLRIASASCLDELRSASTSDFDGVYVGQDLATGARLIEVLDRMAAVADRSDLRRGLRELRSTLADELHRAREANAQLAQEL